MNKFHSTSGDLSYIRGGEDGPYCFLLVHGSGGSHEMMQHTAAHFSKVGKVVIPDLLGHGFSSIANIDYTVEVFAESLIELCEYEKLQKIVFIGMNYGANIGLEIFQRAPDLISHLVLIEPPIFLEPPIVKILEQRIKDLEHPKDNWAQETVESLILNAHTHEREIALKALEMTPPFVKASTFKHLLAWDKNHSFICPIPTLLIQISQPLCAEDKARSIFPNLHVGRVVGSGPWINLEVPAQANSMIDRFLELEIARKTVPELIS